MRNSHKDAAWKRFVKSGAVGDYLSYCETAEEIAPKEKPDEVFDRRSHREGKLHGGERQDNNSTHT